MVNQRSALCIGRSTVVVVFLLLGTFIAFDSYTYRLFSTWSKSMSPDFFTRSSDENADSTSSSLPRETAYKSMSQVGQEGEGASIDSQVPVEDDAEVEANEQLPPTDQLNASSQEKYSRDTEFGSEVPESSNNSNTSVPRAGDVHKRPPQAGINQTRIFSTNSELHDVNDTGSSNEGNDQSRNHFNESESQTSKDTGSLKEGDRTKSSPSTIAAKTTRVSELTSIQKVEVDLWQARAALRRVALNQMNNADKGEFEESDRPADREPRGEAFKNAALFRQSYQEMENRFKVYVYQEGEEPLVHDGPCKEIYSVEGRFIQELHDNNPFVTSDPEEAHVFFLPFSVAMMVTYLYKQNSFDMSPLLRFVQDYIHVVAGIYPYWNRSDGADHFMLSCHDWGPYVSRVDDNLHTKSIRVLCNANTSEGFVPYKDASLPEINLVGGEVPTALGGLPVSARTYLAFFAGADHGPVRPLLFEHWEEKDSEIIVHRQVPATGLRYHEYMKRSKFCICPGGYEVNSPRVVEAIYNDCIPVIIADKFVLPFSDILDWSKFSVQVFEKDIPRLKLILQAVAPETLQRMQNNVKHVRKHFILNQPPEKYDVFHMILHSVWLRRLNIRLLG